MTSVRTPLHLASFRSRHPLARSPGRRRWVCARWGVGSSQPRLFTSLNTRSVSLAAVPNSLFRLPRCSSSLGSCGAVLLAAGFRLSRLRWPGLPPCSAPVGLVFAATPPILLFTHNDLFDRVFICFGCLFFCICFILLRSSVYRGTTTRACEPSTFPPRVSLFVPSLSRFSVFCDRVVFVRLVRLLIISPYPRTTRQHLSTYPFVSHFRDFQE